MIHFRLFERWKGKSLYRSAEPCVDAEDASRFVDYDRAKIALAIPLIHGDALVVQRRGEIFPTVFRCSDANQNLEKKRERERKEGKGREISSASLRRILRDITYSFLSIRNSSGERGGREKKGKPKEKEK